MILIKKEIQQDCLSKFYELQYHFDYCNESQFNTFDIHKKINSALAILACDDDSDDFNKCK